MKCGKCKKDGVTNEHVRECYGVPPRHQQQDTGWKENRRRRQKLKSAANRGVAASASTKKEVEAEGTEGEPKKRKQSKKSKKSKQLKKRRPNLPSNTFDYPSAYLGHRPRERR